jgi:hypothetical protein
MKHVATKYQPKPSQQLADRRRKAVATERATKHMTGCLDGLDDETAIETCRAIVRAFSQIAKRIGGEGRASGVLCGALVDVAPGFEVESGRGAAEALFRKGSDDE